MTLSEEQARAIKSEFMRKYFFSGPSSNYMRGCSSSDLRTWQEKGKEIDLRDGESLDDLCLTVSLRQQPPANIILPAEYKKVRIFYYLDEKTRI